MKTIDALALINDIREEINEKGFQPDMVVEQLQELREIALQEGNPVVTKALRLAYEHIELYQEFAIKYLGKEDEEEENEEEEEDVAEEKVEDSDDEQDDVDNFGYFLELIRAAENRFNRAELLDIIKLLMEFD
ncbi:MAG: hypothetical protein R3E32_00945 [Chitinophagales bacterium]